MANFLLKDYQDIIDDNLIIGTLEEEFNNKWGITLSKEQFSQISVDDFCHFIKIVIAARSAKLPPNVSMWFYCYIDEQAGQFRFSLVSTKYNLPFGCKLNFVRDLEQIVHQFFTSPYTSGIPLTELQVVSFDTPLPLISEKEFILDVWRQRIPLAS